MAQITAALVKELRDKTSAGMMDCKKALSETDGDLEAAVDWLRKKGLSKAAKKAGRVAAEGLVAMATKEDGAGMVGSLVEVNSETDFVARNEAFQATATEIAELGLSTGGDVEALAAAKMGNGNTVADHLTDLIAKIGENMSLRRTVVISANPGVVAGYMHNSVTDGLGKIGVLVALTSDGDKDALADAARKIAMHVAATNPLSLSVDDMDPEAVERERSVFSDQARASGKPENIIEKMVEGRLRKFYEESVLLKQSFVMDPDKSVEAVVSDLAKELGTSVELTGFARMGLGEGIEKKEEDFAAEVAAASGKS